MPTRAIDATCTNIRQPTSSPTASAHANAALIGEGATAVVELVQHYGDTVRRAELIQRIGDIERSADKITHETISVLHSTFITPFDRNDIHRLISGMDDILDLMQDAAESMHLFDIQTLPPAAPERRSA